MGAKRRSIISIFDNGGLIDAPFIDPENPINLDPLRKPLPTTILNRSTPDFPAGTATNATKGVSNNYAATSGIIDSFAPVAIGAIDAIDTGTHTGGRQTVGGQTAKSAIGGLKLGANPALMAATGGLSAPIGLAAGAVVGLLKGKSAQKKALSLQEEQANRLKRSYSDNNLQTNINLTGNRFEDGGMVQPETMEQPVEQAPQERMINVERGEIMVNPMDMTVVQEFLNPNRFSKHGKNQFKEPSGNFVSVPNDHIIIPKKLANRYKSGDVLTRKSIVMQLLSDQADDPMFNVPETPATGVEQFALGGGTGPVDDLPVRKRKRFIIPGSLVNDLLIDPTKVDSSGDTGSMQQPQNTFNEDADIPVATGKKGFLSKINTGSIARTLLQDLPIISQMATNGKGDPYLGENPNVQYNTALSYANQLPEEISVAGNLAANDRSFLVASKAIDNNDTPSARAEKAALLAEKFAGDNSVYTGKETIGAQLKSTKLQALLGLTTAQGADWQQDRRFLTNELRMDAAARENNSAAAIANLSENTQLAQNDAERVKSLNAITHSVNIDPFAKDIMKEDPGFIPFIYQYMTGGKGDYVAAKNEYLSRRNSKDKITIYDKTVTDKKGDSIKTTGTKKEINR